MSKKDKKKSEKKRSAYSEYMDNVIEVKGNLSARSASEAEEQEDQAAVEIIYSPYDVSYERTLLVDEETDEEVPAENAAVIHNEAGSAGILEVSTENVDVADLPFSIGVSSVIGKRKSQQDSVFVPDIQKTMKGDKPRFLCVLSDGMGGLSSGDLASKTVVSTLSKEYYEGIWNTDEKISRAYFVDKANIINEEILDITDASGNHAKTGATMIAAEVNGNEFSFVNIGDSRIYFFRDGKPFQLTHDQNYLSRLMGMVAAGEISEEEARSHPKREALISFCGIDELKLIETNVKPIELKDNDIILLCSDGLYRLLNEQEMLTIIDSAEDDMSMAAYRLTQAANMKNHRGQDNTSVIVIKIIHKNIKEENEL